MNNSINILANNKEGGIKLKSGKGGIDMGTTGTILLSTGTTQPAFISLEPYSNKGTSRIRIISGEGGIKLGSSGKIIIKSENTRTDAIKIDGILNVTNDFYFDQNILC